MEGLTLGQGLAVSQDAIRLRFGMPKATPTHPTNLSHNIPRHFLIHTQACIEFFQILHALAGFGQFVGGSCHEDSNTQEREWLLRE